VEIAIISNLVAEIAITNKVVVGIVTLSRLVVEIAILSNLIVGTVILNKTVVEIAILNKIENLEEIKMSILNALNSLH